MPKDDIRSALGLSEEFHLSSGATIPVAPCGIKDLKRGMALYANTLNKFTLQALFLPNNELLQEDLFALLLLASGNGNKEGKERDKALDEILSKFDEVGDFGSEVVKYIQRFLRIIPRDTTVKEEVESE